MSHTLVVMNTSMQSTVSRESEQNTQCHVCLERGQKFQGPFWDPAIKKFRALFFSGPDLFFLIPYYTPCNDEPTFSRAINLGLRGDNCMLLAHRP